MAAKRSRAGRLSSRRREVESPSYEPGRGDQRRHPQFVQLGARLGAGQPVDDRRLDLERPIRGAVLAAVGLQALDVAPQLVERIVGAQPAVADPGRPAQRHLGLSTDEDRHRLGRRRGHLQLVEVVELAVVLDHAAPPQGAQHLDLLLHPGTAPGEGLFELVELLSHPSGADAEEHPVARQVGGSADRLRHDEGVAGGQHVDVGGEPHALGDRRQGTGHDPDVGPGRLRREAGPPAAAVGVRRLELARVEDVVGQRHLVEAHLLGAPGQLYPVGRRRVHERLAELHRIPSGPARPTASTRSRPARRPW